MYSLRFDDGVTSAGFLLTPRGLASLDASRRLGCRRDSGARCSSGIRRSGALFADATPLMPIGFAPRVQHRLTRAAGERWALMPHAYAFVDPLFSTGIAWGLRAVERLALAFEHAADGDARAGRCDARAVRCGAQRGGGPDRSRRGRRLRGDGALRPVRRAGDALLRDRLVRRGEPAARRRATPSAWKGFLGVGDPVLGPLPRESLERLRRITRGTAATRASAERARGVRPTGSRDAIASRNVAGLADPARRNLYPVDLDVLVERHALLGMSREELISRLPALRGMGPEPMFSPAARRVRRGGATPERQADPRPLQERAPATNLPGMTDSHAP